MKFSFLTYYSTDTFSNRRVRIKHGRSHTCVWIKRDLCEILLTWCQTLALYEVSSVCQWGNTNLCGFTFTSVWLARAKKERKKNDRKIGRIEEKKMYRIEDKKILWEEKRKWREENFEVRKYKRIKEGWWEVKKIIK